MVKIEEHWSYQVVKEIIIKGVFIDLLKDKGSKVAQYYY